MNDYTNDDLYNCCENAQEPHWEDFKFLVLGGCSTAVVNPDAPIAEQETETVGNLHRSEAQFFTIYGFHDEHVPITDVNGFEKAQDILKVFTDMTGLEASIDC